MSRKKTKEPNPIHSKLDDRSVQWAPEGSHPSQVSGIFKDDPTFSEFREILRQQREQDLKLTNEEIDAAIGKEAEKQGCSSSTQTPSHSTKTRTSPSTQE